MLIPSGGGERGKLWGALLGTVMHGGFAYARPLPGASAHILPLRVGWSSGRRGLQGAPFRSPQPGGFYPQEWWQVP